MALMRSDEDPEDEALIPLNAGHDSLGTTKSEPTATSDGADTVSRWSRMAGLETSVGCILTSRSPYPKALMSCACSPQSVQ